MSKNIIRYVEFVFDQLAQHANVPCLNPVPTFKPHEENAENERCKTEFQSATFSSFTFIIDDIRCSQISFSNRRFLILTNFPEIDFSLIEEVGLRICELDNPLIFATIVKDCGLKINPLKSAEDIDQYVFYQKELTDYLGHNWEDLIPYFEPFKLFEIPQDSIFYEWAVEDIAYYLCSCVGALIRLPFGDVLEKMRGLLRSGDVGLPHESIFLSVTSTHWKHAFLELYRCIEALYSIPRAKQLKAELGMLIPAQELGEKCYRNLNWKPREEPSLADVVEVVSFEKICCLNSCILSEYTFDFSEGKKRNSYEKIAGKIYEVRNKLVHYTPMKSAVPLNDQQWESLLILLCVIVEESYSQFSCELIKPGNVKREGVGEEVRPVIS